MPSEVSVTGRTVTGTCDFNRYSHGQYGNSPGCEES